MVQPVKELTTFSPAPSPLPLSFPHSLTRLSYSSPLTQAWPAHPPPCTQARPPLPARSCIAASRSLSLFTPERGALDRALASTPERFKPFPHRTAWQAIPARVRLGADPHFPALEQHALAYALSTLPIPTSGCPYSTLSECATPLAP